MKFYKVLSQEIKYVHYKYVIRVGWHRLNTVIFDICAYIEISFSNQSNYWDQSTVVSCYFVLLQRLYDGGKQYCWFIWFVHKRQQRNYKNV